MTSGGRTMLLYLKNKQHCGVFFFLAEKKFKNVEFYLRGDLKGISVDQIKEMQETVASVVEDKAIIKQQKQYSLTRFCVVLSLKEEYLTKLIAIEQRNREKLSRLNIEYFVVGPLTVYIERLTGKTKYTLTEFEVFTQCTIFTILYERIRLSCLWRE